MNQKPTSIKVGWKDIRIEYVDPTFKKYNADYWGIFPKIFHGFFGGFLGSAFDLVCFSF